MTKRSIAIKPIPGNSSQYLSQRLKLDFPYDCSNRNIAEEVLIRKALQYQRFNDMARLAFYYGLPYLRESAREVYGEKLPERLSDILNNIEIGFSRESE